MALNKIWKSHQSNFRLAASSARLKLLNPLYVGVKNAKLQKRSPHLKARPFISLGAPPQKICRTGNRSAYENLRLNFANAPSER